MKYSPSFYVLVVAPLDRTLAARIPPPSRVGLGPLLLAGFVRRVPNGYRLTPRGFDAYHDLERLVTYHLIEPLWAEMLTEHASDLAPPCERTGWARPEQARSGRAWSGTRHLFERRLARAGGS